MRQFESSTYVLDFRERSSCSRIQSAKHGKEIQVFVCPEHDVTARPIIAKGIRSHDGGDLTVMVTTAAGEQTHDWVYKDLLDAISVHCPG